MKTIILFLSIALCISCSNVKVASVKSDVPRKDNQFIFENDTVKITYRLWARKGKMTFDIYNKLNAPLYFDWKNSAFIPNKKMMSYWQDEVNTEGTYASFGYYSQGSVGSSGKMKSKAIHMERIGVVPPHAQITNNQYTLLPEKFFFETDNAVKTDVPNPKRPGKNISVYQAVYNVDNTPLVFRNYVAICTNEKFDGNVSFIDNSFYVSDLKIMSLKKGSYFKSDDAFYTSKSSAKIIY